MGLRVDYTCDPESPSWCFEVPTLGVMGAADTREGVTTAARDAIRFTLDDEAMGKSRAANDVEYVVVTVNRAMASLP